MFNMLRVLFMEKLKFTILDDDMIRIRVMELPNEMWNHIFGFVDDKTGLSMTCRFFDKLLLDMFRMNMITDINDSFYLKCHNDFSYKYISNIISSIYNHHSFNLIMSKVIVNQQSCDKRIFMLVILNKAFVINSKCKPQYIQQISQILGDCSNLKHTMTTALMTCIYRNAYNILKIMTDNNHTIKYYIGEAFTNKHYNEKNIYQIIKDIEQLTEHKILTHDEFGKQMLIQHSKGFKIFLMEEMYKYMDKYVSTSIKELLFSLE